MTPLQNILFGQFVPPVTVAGTRQHRMLWDGKTRPAPYVEPVKRTYVSAKADTILDCIKANPGLTITQIAKTTGIAKTGVRTMLSKLKEEQAIRLERGAKRAAGGGIQEGTWWAL